ncbi:hypothetical protein [Facklamia miroungae]|uniref:Uncharacterized protein n=1 Tax=Facklamia miroungae TaxID=120956 RepID=A0A1G7TUJ9_9LACT|nr:hypothetical protein [Facklamia miroungae]NKZ29980.1 hypothetical protein [Facklamia miroungae]SDG39036.1 hypothetical protein SAMN05421791_10747 [Facklamia miroungae]
MGLFKRKKKKQADYQEYLNYEQEEGGKLEEDFSTANFDDSINRLPFEEDNDLYHEFMARTGNETDAQDFSSLTEENQTQLFNGQYFDPNVSKVQEVDGYDHSLSNQEMDQNHMPQIDLGVENLTDEDSSKIKKRAKYSAKIDRFLNNGILIVGVLLILVLLIAFLA